MSIKIDIELHPFGNPNNARLLHTIIIWNDVTGTKTRGNYQYKIITRNTEIGRGEIKRFNRKSATAVRLLYLVLSDHYNKKGKNNEYRMFRF